MKDTILVNQGIGSTAVGGRATAWRPRRRACVKVKSPAGNIRLPTVLQKGPYRFFFYAGDRKEPRHVHIERDEKVAKFWLEPVRLQVSGGFSRTEIRRLHELVGRHVTELQEAWDAYFNG